MVPKARVDSACTVIDTWKNGPRARVESVGAVRHLENCPRARVESVGIVRHL
jgi:hypothetical protein